MDKDEQIAALQAIIDEVERRLRLPAGYADNDRVRMALLHIEAFRGKKATDGA